MKKINDKQNIFGDDIGFVEQYDFSTANLSEENRIKAITTVASICYQNPKAVGSESLYNRLLAESQGLPSSSFEFVPVLISMGDTSSIKFIGEDKDINNIMKYSEVITHNGMDYLLTNYRAIVYDVENKLLTENALKFFNTPEECEIIKQHFKVFLFKVDLPTRSQMVRHRISWQELSRRYVSGSRVGFDFYISEGMKKVFSKQKIDCEIEEWCEDPEDLEVPGQPNIIEPFEKPTHIIGVQTAIDICLKVYFAALEQGIKPQEARRVIPQSAYTQIWGAFMPNQLDNYFKLRLHKTAQWEIQQTAIAMQELIK